MPQNIAGIPNVTLSSVYNYMHSYNVPEGTICIHLPVKIISHDPIGHNTKSGYSTVEYLFQGLQISQISWIMGTSMKYVSLKISGNSIVT